jgi:hypothetical protein
LSDAVVGGEGRQGRQGRLKLNQMINLVQMAAARPSKALGSERRVDIALVRERLAQGLQAVVTA